MTNPAFTRRACLRALSGLLAAAAFSRAAHAADPKKMIVLYFSWSGSTQKVAEEIQRLTGCDIARIETVTPYPRDYSETVKIAVPERDGALYLPRKYGSVREDDLPLFNKRRKRTRGQPAGDCKARAQSKDSPRPYGLRLGRRKRFVRRARLARGRRDCAQKRSLNLFQAVINSF